MKATESRMTAYATPRSAVEDDGFLHSTCSAAARHVYEQEIALHDARQTEVNEWISRAEGRLHDALTEYEAARAAANRVAS
jgi:hypothetical protein